MIVRKINDFFLHAHTHRAIRHASLACLIALLNLFPASLFAGAGPTTPPRRDAALIKTSKMPVAKLVPLEQLHLAFKTESDQCETDHYHAASGDKVTAFDLTVIPDPAVYSCGYGKAGKFTVGDTERFWKGRVYVLSVPDADFDGINDTKETGGLDKNKADSDANGVPDNAEDQDKDGLNFADELWLTHTDPTKLSSSNNGNSDSTNTTLETSARNFTAVPVLINIYKNSNADVMHMKAAVKAANVILKQARIRLVALPMRTGETSGDNGDGTFTEAEMKNIRSHGVMELFKLNNNKRGFKVSVGKVLTFANASQTSPGASGHRYPSLIIIQRATAELTGSTLAHEFLHTVTLAGHPKAGDAENTPGNIMVPSDQGRDDFVVSPDPKKGLKNLTLTDGQLAKIKVDEIAKMFGKPGTRKSPSRLTQYQRGYVVDAIDDQTGGANSRYDLTSLVMSSDSDEPMIHFLAMLADRYPANGDVIGMYRVLFDTDNNPSTGSTIEGEAGIDREVAISLARKGFGNNLDASSKIISYPGFSSVPAFPLPILQAMQRMAGSSSVANEHQQDVLEFWVRKDQLNLTANMVPVTITANTTISPGAVDKATLIYDRQRWKKSPTLSLPVGESAQGSTLDFAVTGLSPNDSIQLLLDDTEVFSGMLDASGNANGNFTLAGTLVPGFYFLTALDVGGDFAIGAIEVTKSSASPPQRPTGVKATDGTFSSRVRITFNTVNSASVYRVFRCLNAGNTCGTPIGFPKTTSFDDTRGVPGQVYFYRVRACTATTCGKFSVANTGFSSVAPARPTGVRASDGTFANRVRVSFNAVSGASVYRVFRCLNAGNTCGTPIGFPKTTSFDDTRGVPGQVYVYRVRACTMTTCGKFSVANTGFSSVAPARPTGVNASDGTFSNLVRITFNTVAGATVYRVFRCPDKGSGCGLPIGFPKTGTFDDTKGASGTVFFYRVKACTTNTCSRFSVANPGHRGMKTTADHLLSRQILSGYPAIPALSKVISWLLALLLLGFGLLAIMTWSRKSGIK